MDITITWPIAFGLAAFLVTLVVGLIKTDWFDTDIEESVAWPLIASVVGLLVVGLTVGAWKGSQWVGRRWLAEVRPVNYTLTVSDSADVALEAPEREAVHVLRCDHPFVAHKDGHAVCDKELYLKQQLKDLQEQKAFMKALETGVATGPMWFPVVPR